MARIVVVGAGVVGTATGKGLARAGHSVAFVDIDESRVEALRTEGFAASRTIDLAGPPAFVFLAVPTPSHGTRYDLEPLEIAVRAVGEMLAHSEAFHTIVVRSTVPPGTCDLVVEPLLESASGRRCGDGFSLASNPEFLRAAHALEDFLMPRMTVIGSRSRRSVERLVDLFAPLGGEIRTFSNTVDAELVKCAHNLFNATKISFWNEMWRVARRLGADLDAVAATVARSAEASYNPSYGIRGGAPFGGACLPKDAQGFLGLARDLGLSLPLLTSVVRVNDLMRERVLEEPGIGVEMGTGHPSLVLNGNGSRKPDGDEVLDLRGA